MSYVQSFVSQSLAYVGQVSRGAAIDRAAVSALFSTYEATDVTDAHSFYSGAPFAFVVGTLLLKRFLCPSKTRSRPPMSRRSRSFRKDKDPVLRGVTINQLRAGGIKAK